MTLDDVLARTTIYNGSFIARAYIEGVLYKPSKRGILGINETELGLAAEQSHQD
jgi:hypothetical protein